MDAIKNETPQEILLKYIISAGDKKLRKERLHNKIELDQQVINHELYIMQKNKIIEIDRHGRITSKIPQNAAIGTVYTSNTGAGFIRISEDKTLYIPKGFMKNAIHKDKVLVVPTLKPAKEKNEEGMVLYVIDHGLNRVIGTYVPAENEKFGFVIPDDGRINFDLYIGKNYLNGANPYDKVVASIEEFPKTPGKHPAGKIVEVIGMAGDIKAEQESVIKAMGLPEKFPSEVMKECQIFDKDRPDKWDLSHRTDFRDETIVTIDCDTSKDLDDAISIKRTENGYELGVYIADVAHYVREGTELDKEALNRGNSTYLLNQVIPMLPNILSDNLCSLNPDTQKLVLAVTMQINKNGYVTSHNICEGVIKTSGRLNYSETTKALSGDNKEFINNHGQDIFDMLVIGKELADILLNKRIDRGAIEFGIPETEVVLDENGKCIDIKPSERGIANDMIEEFMLITNETVAKDFFEKGIPFVYRVHPAPMSSKIEMFKTVANIYDIHYDDLNIEDIKPKDIQMILNNIIGNDMETSIKTMLLQSMKQARYSEILTPHFGLAAQYYCHFTSPIRRYADLMIHRIIKMYLRGSFVNDALITKYTKICGDVAKQVSKTERISDQAEKEVIKSKAFEFMVENEDAEYDGYIRSMNKIGMFVALDNSLDGFIKQKGYSFDKDSYVAKINDKTFKIGDRVKVKTYTINHNTKEVMFTIVD